MRQLSISIVFPVHNEATILTKQIKLFLSQLKSYRLRPKEIILVENGSHDGSWRVIQNLHRRYHFIKALHLPQASYGQAIKAGLIQAHSQVIFVFNVDFFDADFIRQALPLLKTADIVIGSKTLAASHDLRSPLRRLTTYFFNVFLRLALNYPGTDTHGIKAIKNTPLLRYCLHRSRTQNELFDTELIIRAHRWGAVLVELPVTITELRPTRYPWTRRIRFTLVDLATAFWSKYLIPNFTQKMVVPDDYGRSPKINQAIISAAQAGIVQIVSILPNWVSLSQINQLKLQAGPIRYSTHLNVVEGKPVSPLKQVRSLVNSRGNFWPLPIFLARLFFNLIDLSQLKFEFSQQIIRLSSLGAKLTHLNSHQHVHLFPPIWDLSLQLTRRFNITHLRSQASIRNALKSKPVKYLAHWPIFWLLTLRYGSNRHSRRELNEIVTHPGAAYYD